VQLKELARERSFSKPALPWCLDFLSLSNALVPVVVTSLVLPPFFVLHMGPKDVPFYVRLFFLSGPRPPRIPLYFSQRLRRGFQPNSTTVSAYPFPTFSPSTGNPFPLPLVTTSLLFFNGAFFACAYPPEAPFPLSTSDC